VSARLRMPAEWEPHEASWLGWPANASDWPGKLAPIPWVYGEMLRRITPGERVRLIVPSAAHAKDARTLMKRVGVDARQVDLLRWSADRGWTRDKGPIFVRQGKGRVIARFGFDAWSKYPDWKLDAQTPVRAGKWLGLPAPRVLHGERHVVLEGGAIDVNRRGTLLTTEECLLDRKKQVRNPGFSRRDYEQVFATALGATNTIWLGKGIVGDDTHGHVDDLARFTDERTIVAIREKNEKDANHRLLEDNWQRLRGARLEDGSKPDVVALPCPAPLWLDGQRLPASYANFYVANACVIVPTFNDPNDRIALGVLGELFRRPVVGIHAVDLVWGLGTLHCLTQQEPLA
jgi:agmatine deiminase